MPPKKNKTLDTKVAKEPKPKILKTKKKKQMSPEQIVVFMIKRNKCIDRYRNGIMKTLKTIKRKTKNNPPKIVIKIE